MAEQSPGLFPDQDGSIGPAHLRDVSPAEISQDFMLISEETITIIEDNKLIALAAKTDTGATFLMELLETTGQILPAHEVAKYKHDTEHHPNISELLSRATDMEEQQSHDRLIKEYLTRQAKIPKWEDAKRKISVAFSYYQENFANSDDINPVIELSDRTDKYIDESPLLAYLVKLNIKAQTDRSVRASTEAKNNIKEAERIVRLMILEETDKLTF